MRSQEFSGRTVDEAIFHGLNELGLSIDAVEIETLQTESKGLFGLGAKNAIIRITEREIEVKPDFVAIAAESKQARQSERERSPQQEERRGDGNRGRDNNNRGRDDRRGSSRDNRGERRDFEHGARETVQQYKYTAEFAESCESAAFLRELLEKMGVAATVEGCEADDGLRLNIVSGEEGLLIGRRGETLDAIQYITSLYANRSRKDRDYIRVTVDTEGYRVRREDTLRRLAHRTAVQAVRSGKPQRMDPMNAYERRILHASLQDFRGASTHSEGEEPNRYVVITPDR
jgi:spoIIIJ-associated protein